jgi:hypothetical protein
MLFAFLSSVSFGQDNLISDKKLYSELYTYLLKSSNTYEIDEAGNRLADSTLFPRGMEITSRILKADSVIENKNLVGVYEFRFTCNSCAGYLYFLYPDGKKKFIDLYTRDFDFAKLLEQTRTFLHTYCKTYSEDEKIRTEKGVVELIYSR